MRVLDEETDRDVITQWREEAETVESVDAFIDKLVTEYQHDYGTIVHACHSVMLAALNKLNRSEQGGITGFQASCLGWVLVPKMFCIEDGTPLRLIDYSNMLYPQYADRFQKTISPDTWAFLQKEAEESEKDPNFIEHATSEVKSHIRAIREGHVPFGYTVVEPE